MWKDRPGARGHTRHPPARHGYRNRRSAWAPARDGRRNGGAVDAAASRWAAAVVATPTADHDAVVRTLLGRGIPTFCEKPITLDPTTTSELGRMAGDAGVPLRSGLQRRFDPAIRTVRSVLESGEIGDLLWLALSTRDPAPPPRDYLTRSGGVFLDMHIHDIDVLVWLLGTVDLGITALGGGQDQPELAGLNDYGTTCLALRSRTGTLATITGSRWSPTGYAVELTALGRLGELRLRSDGTVTVHMGDTITTVHAGSGTVASSFVDRFADAYQAAISDFIGEVDGATGSGAGWRDDLVAVGIGQVAHIAAARPTWFLDRPYGAQSPRRSAARASA